jgi:hypothetical protein
MPEVIVKLDALPDRGVSRVRRRSGIRVRRDMAHAKRQIAGRVECRFGESCLQQMSGLRYGSAIIRGAGTESFYAKSAGAIPIPDSSPGIYRDRLRTPQ